MFWSRYKLLKMDLKYLFSGQKALGYLLTFCECRKRFC